MTKNELLNQLFLHGAKVRRKSWRSGAWIKFNTSGDKAFLFVDESNQTSTNWLTLLIEEDEWEIYKEPTKTKTVWQWRSTVKPGVWVVSPHLMTETEAEDVFTGLNLYEKHAGPWEVSVK